MPDDDKFPEVLAAVLAKLLPDEQTQAAARALLDTHREKVRTICCTTARMGTRVVMMNAADEELLGALEELADTEHDVV